MPLVSLLLAPEEQSTEQNQDKSQRFIKGFVLKVWYKYKNNSCYECGQTFCALFWLLFISYSVPSVVYTHKHKHTHTPIHLPSCLTQVTAIHQQVQEQ